MSKLKVIYENDDFLVVDKPTGLTVQAGHGQTGVTLVDLLSEYLPASPLASERMGLVHRLDKDTSGLLLVAKTLPMFDYLKTLFKNRQIAKTYLTLVEGNLSPKLGIIDIPLKRDMVQKTKFSASATGKPAKTQYEVLEYLSGRTYLKAMPHTGRTHQIRVHFSAIGHPVVGDPKYNPTPASVRLFLHSHQIAFTDLHGETRSFTSPLPADLVRFKNII